MTQGLRRIDILDAILDAGQASDNPHNWRRFFGVNARAKAIPRFEIETTHQVPTEMRTSSLAIAPELPSVPVPEQRRTVEQLQLSVREQEVLDLFAPTGEVVSARNLADMLECSLKSLKRNELHELQVKGAIESVPGRGYRRKA